MGFATGRRAPGLVAALLLAAFFLHAVLLAAGFERLSNDDAARVLMALELTPANALEPLIWPPLHRLLLGLALDLHGDVVWVPRLFSVALGLGLLLALLLLARRLSDDPRVLLATGLLALVAPHRLLLGSVPLADILMLLLLVVAAERVLGWLREGHAPMLLAGCTLAGLATAVRYEAWFVALCLGAMLAWRWWRGGLGFGRLVAAGVLLSAFPLFWIGNSLAWYGSLDNLAITAQQFRAITGEQAATQAVLLNPLGPLLWRELAWNPAAALGGLALLALARRDPALRAFGLAFFLPLPVLALAMLASGSAPLAASWRLVGIWILLALPFGALVLVRLADIVAARLRAPGRAALALVLLPALALPALRDIRVARSAMFNWETMSWRHDTPAGRAAVAELARLGGGRVVVDSLDNLDFLDVMVGSGAPELFVTSADAPASDVALHVPMAEHLHEAGEEELVARYLADRFELRAGGGHGAHAQHEIRGADIRAAAGRPALEASPLAERVAGWPDWTLYRLRPEALAGAQR
ncbi:hypothetical protein [Falsiroseomonas sp.]|uniref:hypothetical protein n=1 Tax=Falsiroseomonas sp. TaxID=2870721 RepID=UPI0035619CE7